MTIKLFILFNRVKLSGNSLFRPSVVTQFIEQTLFTQFFGQSHVGNALSSVGNASSSVGNAPSSVGNALSSVGNASFSVGNAPSSVGNESSSVGNDSFKTLVFSELFHLDLLASGN